MKVKTPNKEVTLEFHGGVGSVTGASYLLTTPKAKVLVDCGLFQGARSAEKLNFENFKYNPKEIDAVFVTHSHIDHIGRLPILIKHGFTGSIYSLPPTKELSEILLRDSLHFVKDEKKPLFQEADIEKVIKHWQTTEYDKKFSIKDIDVVLKNSGHILGSAMIEFSVLDKKILFSGDFGNVPSVLLPTPDDLADDTDYLVIESTYGNRVHEKADQRTLNLERAIEDVVTSRGTLLMPVFATERTQDILFELNEMLRHHRVPELPVFVDSPLAIHATEVFKKYPEYYNNDVKKVLKKDPHIFDFEKLMMTETVDESKRINNIQPPKVILAGSGMSRGGRIVHHERRYLQDSRSILLLVGYQTMGSLGRLLLDGAKEVTVLGETIPVRATVRMISGYSAHADAPQLFQFVKKGRKSLKKVFVVQGEDEASNTFALDIKDKLGISAIVPELYEKFILD